MFTLCVPTLCSGCLGGLPALSGRWCFAHAGIFFGLVNGPR